MRRLRQLSCVVSYARGGGSSGAFVSDGGVRAAAEATRRISRDAPETTTCCAATAPEPQGTIVWQPVGTEGDLQGEGNGDAGASAAELCCIHAGETSAEVFVIAMLAIPSPLPERGQAKPLVTRVELTRDMAENRASIGRKKRRMVFTIYRLKSPGKSHQVLVRMRAPGATPTQRLLSGSCPFSH